MAAGGLKPIPYLLLDSWSLAEGEQPLTAATLGMANRQKHQTSASNSPASLCLAVVLVDASARRNYEKQLYLRKARELERQTDLILAHEKSDAPLFQSWFETAFETELERCRRLGGDIRNLDEFLFDIARYAEAAEVSEMQACRILDKAREQGTEKEVWEALYQSVRARYAEALADEEDEIEDLDETPTSDNYRTGARGDGEKRTATASRPSISDQLLRSIYRQLVRLLHPDLVGSSPRQESLWQQVQSAYQRRDLQRLEKLLKSVQTQDEREAAIDLSVLPIGDVIALRKDVESRLQALRRDISKAKASPSWKFSWVMRNPIEMDRIFSDIEQVFEDDLVDLATTKAALEDRLNELRGLAPTFRPARSRGRSRKRR